MGGRTETTGYGRQLTVSLPETQTHVGIGTGTYSIVIKGSDTAERFAIVDMLVPSGDGPMPHAHACDETFFVMEGEVTVFVGQTRALATTGEAVNIPGWAPHVFYNLSGAPARLLCVASPAGLDRQFLEIGVKVPTRTTPAPPPSTDEKAELMKKLPTIVEKYDGKLLPPDAFFHMMSAEEIELVKKTAGDQ